MTYQPRRNPVRPGRPPQGNTDHLVLLTDIVHHGRLPDDYQLTSALIPIELKPDDMTDIWVTSSHHCPEGGLACFLQLKGPYVSRAGSLVAQYFGKDTAIASKETRKSRGDTFRTAMENWGQEVTIFLHMPERYTRLMAQKTADLPTSTTGLTRSTSTSPTTATSTAWRSELLAQCFQGNTSY
jgi:hypothetical protein